MTQAFHWLATRFSNCTDYRFELVAAGASGDLAYTLGYEHFSFSMDGGPIQPFTLRVTQPGRSVPPTHRRSRRSSSGPGPRWGHIGATSHPNVSDNSGHERSTNIPAQQSSHLPNRAGSD